MRDAMANGRLLTACARNTPLPRERLQGMRVRGLAVLVEHCEASVTVHVP